MVLFRRQRAEHVAERAHADVEEARVAFAGRKERFHALQGCSTHNCESFWLRSFGVLAAGGERGLSDERRTELQVRKPECVQPPEERHVRAWALVSEVQPTRTADGRRADQQPCLEEMEFSPGHPIHATETRCLCEKSEI